MPKRSAGLLLYRGPASKLEVFLVHPGGPFWAKKETGCWSIPKGEYQEGEGALDAARREFHEETGFDVEGEFVELGTIRQASGKLVTAWAVRGDCDPRQLKSNVCQMEWPPRSKRMIEVPEVDRGEWFSIMEARERMIAAQRPLLDALAEAAGAESE